MVSPHVILISEEVFPLNRKVCILSYLSGWIIYNRPTIHSKNKVKRKLILLTSLPETKRDESSAQRMSWHETAASMSLIYNKNSKGPRIDPCGTLRKTTLGSEKIPLFFFFYSCLACTRYETTLTLPTKKLGCHEIETNISGAYEGYFQQA